MSLPALHLRPAAAAATPTGAKDADGKRVEFEIDPRRSFIARHCVQVPWHLYGRKHNPKRIVKLIDPDVVGEDALDTRLQRKRLSNIVQVVDSNAYRSHYQGGSPIDFYITDVLNDTRLDPSMKMVGKPNPTQSPAVQAWATAHALRPAPPDVVWVMDFVSMDPADPGEANAGFARFCLVRQDSTTLLERLMGALGHIDDSMTDENMGGDRRVAARTEPEDAPAVPWQLRQGTVDFYENRRQSLVDAIRKTMADLPAEQQQSMQAALEPPAKLQRTGACLAP
tara:strand:+ start:1222 stop:2067 length:846 start_codon:yes stop_codon:yes gene_type:complete